MVSVLKYAALSLAVASATASAGSVEVHRFEPTQANAELRVIVEVGTSTICGYREAPHLIEHLVLTDTKHGKTSPEIMLKLHEHGITLAALTHPDFTEYTLTGPESQLDRMTSIMADFMGVSSLPKSGFEAEKKVILNEVHAQPSFVSTATLYERFIGEHTEAPMPCDSDGKQFMSYGYDEINDLFKAHYQPENMKVIAVTKQKGADLSPLVDAINGRPAAPVLTSQIWDRPTATPYPLVMIGETVEFALPIDGRMRFPADAAQAFADRTRFAIQNHVRSTQNLYTTRTYLSQGLQGGWIRFEIPKASPENVTKLKQLIENAITNVNQLQSGNDPIWKSYGHKVSDRHFGDLVVAHKPVSTSEALVYKFKALFF